MTINFPEIHTEATEILKDVYGEDAQFRDGQYEAVEATMTKERTLVVQRTGWGKSLIYFMCTKMFRKQGRGFTMVISPLLALMENQVEMARRMGISCDVLNSTVKERRREIIYDLENNNLDLIFITPETLFNDDIQRELPHLNIGLFVIDEAHCISDWGHDFRLEYGKIGKIVKGLAPDVTVLATTATANDRVIQDLKTQLNGDVFVSKGSLSRDSLHIQVLNLQSKTDRYAWILENINKLPGTGIIYCLTQRDCDYLADFLVKNDIPAMSYYSKSPELEHTNATAIEYFHENEIKAIVSTVKLGMGYDKDDISFVIHYQSPSNIVAYYQQIGRAGRSISDAYIFLMSGEEDEEINNYFINTAFPYKYEVNNILKFMVGRDGTSPSQVSREINMRRNRIDKALAFLENEGCIRRDKRFYYLTPKRFIYDEKHYNAVTETRKLELDQMRQLITTDKCYSEYISTCLDDRTAKPCGKCANCTGEDIMDGLSLSSEFQKKALDYINSLISEIKPRKLWPDGRRISFITQDGICLCKYRDPGYGQLVRDGKCSYNQSFCDELVANCAKTLKERIDLSDIKFITNVPSLRSDLVEDFAKRLARTLHMKYVDLLGKTEAKPQSEMENGYHQYINAFNSFFAKDTSMPENVLLVDDIIDSKWTMTVCAFKLMEAGCKKVYPFALADNSISSME